MTVDQQAQELKSLVHVHWLVGAHGNLVCLFEEAAAEATPVFPLWQGRTVSGYGGCDNLGLTMNEKVDDLAPRPPPSRGGLLVMDHCPGGPRKCYIEIGEGEEKVKHEISEKEFARICELWSRDQRK